MKHDTKGRLHLLNLGLLCCFFTLMFEGCVFLAKETFSEPDSTGFEEKERSVLQFKEIGFVLRGAYRDHCTGRFAFWGILIPVIPMPCFSPQHVPQHFEIVLIIIPREEEFAINFRQVETVLNGTKHYPTKVTILGNQSFRSTTSQRRNPIPFCERLEKGKTFYQRELETQLIKPIPIHKGICAWLSYSSLPSKLKDPFIININGLTMNISPIPIPHFHVTPKTQWYFSIMGN